jgi:hypothetical protein
VNYEIEAYEGELKKLRSEHESMVTVLKHLLSEKTGHYFICGEGGEKDSMGLPDTILICPSYGLDGVAMYKKYKEYSAPGY